LIQYSLIRRIPAAALIAGLLVALSTQTAAAQEESSASAISAGVSRSAPELNVSIAVFDPGIPEDASTHRRLQVYPRIREIEALYLPFVLRETLVNANEWGAVRVVPAADVAAELHLSGTIVWSDGETLELRIEATDASGREWLSKVYAGVATAGASQADNEPGPLGYQKLYDDIAADLKAARAVLDAETFTEIVDVSFLRYAIQLAPSAFDGYLNSMPDGTFSVNRLPAENDPMLERLGRIRGVEYLITDAVDTKFQELHAEIASTYELWRTYRREFAQYQIDEAKRLQRVEIDAPKGSFEAIMASYDNYKWTRIAEQEQESWAVGFDNEVGPTIEKMEDRVAELEGWVDQQYAEWSTLLGQLFELETGGTE
jgi:hypothetical protein